MPEKEFFELPKKFLPEPLVVEKHQRPKGPFCYYILFFFYVINIMATEAKQHILL